MHSRRDLARLAVTGAAAAVALPVASAQAADSDTNLIFTKENPAHWAGKEATHVPQVTVSGSMLMVKTPHPMSDAHFIVSHSVVLDGGKYLDRKVFTPKDTPESMFTLPAGYKGKVTVASTCNLHDWWVNTITV
jgi:superoxide reductase